MATNGDGARETLRDVMARLDPGIDIDTPDGGTVTVSRDWLRLGPWEQDIVVRVGDGPAITVPAGQSIRFHTPCAPGEE